MKRDLEENQNYIKYLKVTPKLIRPCTCPGRAVHQYCMTANVIRNNSIACPRCDMAYDLYVKKEKLCNPKIVRLILNYSVFIGLIVVVAAVVLIIDGYLKTLNAH